MKPRRRASLRAVLTSAAALACAGAAWASWSDWFQKVKDTMSQSSSDRAAGGQNSQDTAAVRGLNDEDAAGDHKGRNYGAIDKLDRIRITDAELQSFIREAKLAP